MIKKYYVVLTGYNPGIYESRSEAEKQVKWFAWAKFKSFENLAEAKKAFETKNFEQKNFQDWKSILPQNVVFCDWASSWNPWNMEFKIVDRNGFILYHSPIFEFSTNNIWEFLAIAKAFEISQNDLIFSDSKIAIAWAKQWVCKTKLEKNSKNENSFLEIKKAEKILQNADLSRLKFWNSWVYWEIPADFWRK